ncbi:M48 family metallopeptidase [Trichlorobacter ammonificans]|uniref:YgjP-like metallopeptidase domain-containing protein n=1 Tax=Trichlorobacter ammonificans TaxID=2916410 RepID=A0ABM9D7A3_9BACT|nr:SprT family zinc-dependent metalloprotease [Trichlorobacter ammonificans]CAH2030268.1 conserved protein of unknown function [Trichlorobacter ammonificans]
MTSPARLMDINGITVELVRKPIKNLHIRLYPPDGSRVLVSAPKRMSLAAVRQAVVDSLDWIRKHQQKLSTRPQPPPPSYGTGDPHYFLGSCLRLAVHLHHGRPAVVQRHGTLELRVPPDTPVAYRASLLNEWYRSQLKAMIPDLLAQWQQIVGVQVAAWGVKRMKTRWGTCNPRARRIWLNLELAKRPLHCLEYVIVHELVHLLEQSHNARFTGFMDRFMPLWRQHREELRQPQHGQSCEWDA